MIGALRVALMPPACGLSSICNKVLFCSVLVNSYLEKVHMLTFSYKNLVLTVCHFLRCPTFPKQTIIYSKDDSCFFWNTHTKKKKKKMGKNVFSCLRNTSKIATSTCFCFRVWLTYSSSYHINPVKHPALKMPSASFPKIMIYNLHEFLFAT